MNFTPHNAELVMRGRKIQTRRKPHTEAPAENDRSYIHAGLLLYHLIYENDERDSPIVEVEVLNPVAGKWRKLWAVGDVVAVCPGRGKKAIGRIRITRIRHERLQDISEDDAQAEGAHAIWFKVQAVDHNDWPEIDTYSYRYGFEELWQSIYKGQAGKQWSDNPYVFALDFEVVQA